MLNLPKATETWGAKNTSACMWQNKIKIYDHDDKTSEMKY